MTIFIIIFDTIAFTTSYGDRLEGQEYIVIMFVLNFKA